MPEYTHFPSLPWTENKLLEGSPLWWEIWNWSFWREDASGRFSIVICAWQGHTGALDDSVSVFSPGASRTSALESLSRGWGASGWKGFYVAASLIIWIRMQPVHWCFRHLWKWANYRESLISTEMSYLVNRKRNSPNSLMFARGIYDALRNNLLCVTCHVSLFKLFQTFPSHKS